MIYVTSDLHGISPERFDELLLTAHFGADDELYILGDVIDRGTWGPELLKKIMTMPNVKMLMGNHEWLLCGCSYILDDLSPDVCDRLTEHQIKMVTGWVKNGAEPTLAGFREMKENEPGTVDRIMDFVRGLPLYAEVSAGGRDFILTHAGLGNFDSERTMKDYTDHDLLWNRPSVDDRYYEDRLTVFGHTPVPYLTGSPERRAFVTPTWIDIDTGAASGYDPMLLRLDDMKEYYLS